ncbi:hypothetical protein [Alkalihalobacillus sp. AL-G]|uniref:hypothetical protein n=1 Tax=Alkalihalobacillus sp. AL-G TaxID=2926399 RepID=UPI00272DA354|nr:hypothetical protein [Alkalihalobacillus sp. AL-G]WLD94655.1 hypothetical protein MOJ78_07170 [Alkalihalobacillus sp. AL-G]
MDEKLTKLRESMDETVFKDTGISTEEKYKILNALGHQKKLGLFKSRILNPILTVMVSLVLIPYIFYFGYENLTESTYTQTNRNQEGYENIFSSKHIDDIGVRTAIKMGHGQILDQTFYDKTQDIRVNFERVMTDDKETKLLLTFQSKKTDLKNYYLDIFEGKTSINLIAGNHKVELDNVGWGSRYYNRKENLVAEALSFESIKEYTGQDIRLEIQDLTIYDGNGSGRVQTDWPLEFKVDQSAILERETIEINKEFTFKNITYTIRQVEFSALETRVVVTGPDTRLLTDENGVQYQVKSKLELQYLNARKIDEEFGYIVDGKKSGVFLRSSGARVDPIFSKGEMQGADDEYIMVFAPVKDREDCILLIGDDIKIPLTK